VIFARIFLVFRPSSRIGVQGSLALLLSPAPLLVSRSRPPRLSPSRSRPSSPSGSSLSLPSICQFISASLSRALRHGRSRGHEVAPRRSVRRATNKKSESRAASVCVTRMRACANISRLFGGSYSRAAPLSVRVAEDDGLSLSTIVAIVHWQSIYKIIPIRLCCIALSVVN